MIRILFLGEIVGRPGIASIKKALVGLKEKYSIDYTIANGEGTTNGFGLGVAHAIQLSKLGVDLITGGEKIFFKVDMVDFIAKTGFILRPLNYPPASPGRGIKNINIKGKDIIVINLIGQSGLSRLSVNNPFVTIENFLKKTTGSPIVLIQFHASTTAEKTTMLHFLDGKASAIIGTHTKALTSDATVTEKGTAYITDNGRVGSLMSVGGLDPESEIKKHKSQIPERSKEWWSDPVIQAVIVDIDEESGKALSIETINEHIEVDRPKEA